MICNHCGFCCVQYDVIIVDDPAKGIVDGNVKHKPTGVRCQHLTTDDTGSMRCAIHGYPWYKNTPCADFGQIEDTPDTLCRTGGYMLENSQLHRELVLEVK